MMSLALILATLIPVPGNAQAPANPGAETAVLSPWSAFPATPSIPTAGVDSGATTGSQESPVRVVVGGQAIDFDFPDLPPFIQDGRVLVPMRRIFTALGAQVAWNGTTRTVHALRADVSIELPIGAPTATVNGRRIELAVPAQLIAGRTYVPLRFVAEALDEQVGWDPAQRQVTITRADPAARMALRAEAVAATLPPAPPVLTPFARQRGARLTAPTRAASAVVNALDVAGSYPGQGIIWVRIKQPGGTEQEQYLALSAGSFAGKVHLTAGKGDYEVRIWAPEKSGSNQYFELAALKATNVSPLSHEPITYLKEYFAAGLSLSLGHEENLKADTDVRFSGTAPAALAGRYLWVESQPEGQPESARFNEFLRLPAGAFSGAFHLNSGPGRYRVTVRLQQTGDSRTFTDVLTFAITNTSPNVVRAMNLTLDAHTRPFRFSPPAGDLSHSSGSVRVTGTSTNPAFAGSTVWVRLRHGGETRDEHLPVRDGAFGRTVTLGMGAGQYDVEVLVPVVPGGNEYMLAASWSTTNSDSRLVRGLELSTAFFDRGIDLTSPETSGTSGDTSFRLAGTVGPATKGARETNLLIIKTRKGDDEAQYLARVEGGRFDAKVWLRFGPGTYQVTLLAPISNTEAEVLASFDVSNTGQNDLRDTLPSGRSESDDPAIQALAAEIVKRMPTDLDRVRALHDWVAQKVSYDYRKFETLSFAWDDTALKALRLRTGVCQDYAFLTVALLRAQGFRAREVVGEATSAAQRVSHAWVEVWVNERWLTMDPTWDAGYLSVAGFVPEFTYRYFDPKPDDFARDHFRKGLEY